MNPLYPKYQILYIKCFTFWKKLKEKIYGQIIYIGSGVFLRDGSESEKKRLPGSETLLFTWEFTGFHLCAVIAICPWQCEQWFIYNVICIRNEDHGFCIRWLNDDFAHELKLSHLGICLHQKRRECWLFSLVYPASTHCKMINHLIYKNTMIRM